MSGGAVSLAGWYGKLACLGDFASRRLSAEFIARWDGWLQEAIAASRAQLGEGWLEAYLTSAVWRFVEWAESDAEAVHAGVLMPSVDKVGRYFPLCVAAALPRMPARERDLRALFDWLDQIEALALETLDTHRSAQQFDDALLAAPAPEPEPDTSALMTLLANMLRGDDCGADLGPLHLPRGDVLAETLIELSARSFAATARGSSLWWAGAQSADNPPLFACRGLPDGERFTAMLRASPAPPA